MTNLNQQEWWEKAQRDDNAIIIDVRTQNEYNGGKIPDATNIDIYKGDEFIEAIKKLDSLKSYYVYCAAGVRSQKACDVMNQLGITNTYNLTGGISSWTGPVVTR